MKSCALIILIVTGLVSPIDSAFAQVIGGALERLEQKKQINLEYKRNSTRIDKSNNKNCVACKQRDARARIDYLERVLVARGSESYQSIIKQQILADDKFAKRCWRALKKKNIDVFFTINEDGMVEDIASFPRKQSIGCLKRRIKSLKFPMPEEIHHAWLMLSEAEQSLPQT